MHMTMTKAMRKITISIPEELVRFTDDRARKLGASRSRVIGLALTEAKLKDEQRLAAEGYRFYAAAADDQPESSPDALSPAWAEQSPDVDAERPAHGG